MVSCAIALLYAFPYQPRINNPNENVRFYMTAAIVDHGTYAIDDLRKHWGWVNDAGVRDGHYYSVKAPGTSFAGVPGYALYRAYLKLAGRSFDRSTALWVCRVSAQILPTLAWLYALSRFLARFTVEPALRLALVFALFFGSLLYGYTLIFVSHSASALYAFSVPMLLHGRREISGLRAFAAGLCAALVTLFEYPGLLFSVPLALYALYTVGLRRAYAVCLGGLLPLLAMMHFQWRAWGNPLTPGHRFLENPSYRALSEQGFFGATRFDLQAATGLLFDPGFGLFPLSPILLLAFPGAFLALRKRSLRALAMTSLLGTFGTFLAICAMNNWRGGWTIGPRYLAVVVPFLGLFALIALDALARRARPLACGLAIGLTASGLCTSGLLSAYYPHVPEALTRPFGDLLVPLVRFGFAPYNAGAYAGVFGTASMTPLFLTFGAIVFYLFMRAARWQGWKRGSAMAAVALVAFLITMAPHLLQHSEGRPARRALALVTREWSPPAHDDLARLQAMAPELRDALWEQRVKMIREALGRADEKRFGSRPRAP